MVEEVLRELSNLSEEELLKKLYELTGQGQEQSQPQRQEQPVVEDGTGNGGTTEEVEDVVDDVIRQVAGDSEEDEEEEVQGQGQGQDKADAVIEILKRMSPEERAKWAVENGPEAVLKLMELVEMELKEYVEQKSVESKQAVLDTIVQDWVKKHQDIVGDKRMSLIAEGIDMALMKRKGKMSYLDFTPAELEEHLEQVAKLVKEIAGKGGDADAREGLTEEEGRGKETVPTHVGDLGPGVGTGGGGGGAEVLLSALDDPLKLEEVVGKMDDRKLAELLMKVEQRRT